VAGLQPFDWRTGGPSEGFVVVVGRPACRLNLAMYKSNRRSISIFYLNDTHSRCQKCLTEKATKVNSAIVHHKFITGPGGQPAGFSLAAGQLFLAAGRLICRRFLGGF